MEHCPIFVTENFHNIFIQCQYHPPLRGRLHGAFSTPGLNSERVLQLGIAGIKLVGPYSGAALLIMHSYAKLKRGRHFNGGGTLTGAMLARVNTIDEFWTLWEFTRSSNHSLLLHKFTQSEEISPKITAKISCGQSCQTGLPSGTGQIYNLFIYKWPSQICHK